MNTMPTPAAVTPAGSYGSTRFNALRHGVLSRYVVLAWEDETEYRALLDALVDEHAPDGPTQEHLVEEIAGIIWRKRRLHMAEAAMCREKLRQDATASFAPDDLASAALMPITGSIAHHASIPKALAATPAETARELRDLKRDQGMTRRAWSILETGGPDAYPHALAALREDTRASWLEHLAEQAGDGQCYSPDANSLKDWIKRYWKEWYEGPIAELEHRETIRDHALGAAYAARGLDMLARYEVHLDRKLERTLSTLIRLRELRPPVLPG